MIVRILRGDSGEYLPQAIHCGSGIIRVGITGCPKTVVSLVPQMKYLVRMIFTNDFYRPQRSCGQGNIFAPVYHSVHRRGGGIPEGTEVDPPGADTPLGADPPWSRHPAGADNPPPTGSRLRHTVYARPVRILLECILVLTKVLTIS